MPDHSFVTTSQFQSICESLPDPTFILTQSGRYAAILGGKDKRYYHDGSSLLGKLISDVLVPAKAQMFLQGIEQALSSGQMLVLEYELSALDVKGLPTEGPVEPIWFEGRVTAMDHRVGDEKAVIWVASNITASKRLQQQLQQQAMSDELTGLSNRRALMQALEQAYADFKAHARNAWIVSFDVDRFKSINDGLGHPAGDQALRDLAREVKQLAAPEDWVCRVGGDEFAVLCQSGRTMADMAAFSRQLLHRGQSVLKPYATGGRAPGLSVGIAHFIASDRSLEDILRRVDQALYSSKKQGGQQVNITGRSTA